MDLIIGGAYQGKRAFAENTLGIPAADIFTCAGSGIDFTKTCIDRLEEFTLACVKENKDPLEILKRQDLSGKTLICMDVFCGVVPIDPELRRWRQTTGLTCQYLASRADRVYRIFCGLEQRLK